MIDDQQLHIIYKLNCNLNSKVDNNSNAYIIYKEINI